MDKSESELLADWDVVSSVDTEQVNGANDAKLSSTTTNNDAEDNANKTETVVEHSEPVSGIITVDDKTAIEADKITEPDAEQAIEADVASEHTSEASAEEISELVTVIEQISEVEAVRELNSELDDILEQEADTACEEVTKEVVSDIVDSTVKSTELDSVKTIDENIEKIDGSSDKKIDNDREIEETLSDDNHNMSTDTNVVDNCDDRATSSSLDSSMEHIQIEYCGASRVQDIPELIDLVEQDNAAIDSSSSDIDIIDENMEENITSSFVHPLSLSISSSIDTSSMMTTPSETVKEIKTEKGTEDTSTIPKTESHKETYRKLGFSRDEPESYLKPYSSTTKSEAYSKTSENFQKSRHGGQESEGTRQQRRRSPPRQAGGGLVGAIKRFLRNMTHVEWSILGGLMLCFYLTVVFNQTNIFAVVERENVVSQMKHMIDELKQDNKMLKDQMLSEMKNEKVFSSVEHQIKELKKENSKLNHMLYDVVKVLEEQKDSQEKFKKKEPDYASPFKKEINKLKEHINILKIDNEDLQKQLVRMRYASYSQGGTDKTEEKAKTHKDEIKPDEAFTEEISLDINSLKKWNELVTLLSKELGLSSENEPIKEEKPHSDFKDNVSWYWKVFLKEFKGTFKDFKENVTSIFSNYKQANEKAVSEIYKFVKEFFTVEENNRQFAPPDADSSQWKNIGDFVNDLKGKWTNIKDRIYASDVKDFLKNFRKSGEADWPPEKTKSGGHESHDKKPADFERKPTTVHFEPEQKATTEPDSEYDIVQTNSEDAKWMFKRAELRAELRDTEEEDPSENWFLKKKRRDSQDDSGKFRY